MFLLSEAQYHHFFGPQSKSQLGSRLPDPTFPNPLSPKNISHAFQLLIKRKEASHYGTPKSHVDPSNDEPTPMTTKNSSSSYSDGIGNVQGMDITFSVSGVPHGKIYQLPPVNSTNSLYPEENMTNSTLDNHGLTQLQPNHLHYNPYYPQTMNQLLGWRYVYPTKQFLYTSNGRGDKSLFSFRIPNICLS